MPLFFVARQVKKSGNEVDYAGSLKWLYGPDLSQNVLIRALNYEEPGRRLGNFSLFFDLMLSGRKFTPK
jgi:hypothetical protein